MRWGIFADIHGNLEALNAVLMAFSQERIDKYLCLGDIVGYGANPAECIAGVKKINPVIIAGNHDWATVDLLDIEYFNPQAKTALLWTQQFLSCEDKRFLESLELVYQNGQLTLVHGSLVQPEKFDYISNLSTARKTFQLLGTRLLFIGHSHRPLIFIKEGENYQYIVQERLKLEKTQSYIVNAGSVGQPRDSDPRASYVVYDSEENVVQIKRVGYDVRSARDKIIKAGLPRILAERLEIGR